MRAQHEEIREDLIQRSDDECPVDGCDLDPGAPWICELHWRLIPIALRREINDACTVVEAADRSLPSFATILDRWLDLAAQAVGLVEQSEANAARGR